MEPIGVATHWLDKCTFHIQFICFKLVFMVFLSVTRKDLFIEYNGCRRIANRNAHDLNLLFNVRKESSMIVSPPILRLEELLVFGVCSVSLPSWPKANLEGYHENFL